LDAVITCYRLNISGDACIPHKARFTGHTHRAHHGERLMSQGQNKPADIERHTQAWIKAHQAMLDGWIAAGRAAAKP
jgi:ABC-type proline/glycine betaine transport system substrate-binding protein